jgi:outer membrane lipopolysaccharide assembly protein LptE/RlpB
MSLFKRGDMQMPRALKPKLRWGFVALTLFVCACGYRFPGGGGLPGGIDTVFIPLFTNRSNEIGVENIITDDLTNEFILQRKGALADENKADGVLSGVIVSVLTRTISQTGEGASVEREVVVTVGLKLTDKDGQLTWAVQRLSGREPYDVGNNSIETNRRRRDAIEILSTRLAEKIYNRLTDNF